MKHLDINDVLDLIARVTGRPPKRSGNAWTCLCPAHDDRSPSLSVSLGRDGNLLAHCHSGCDFTDILDALGLSAGTFMASTSTAPAPTSAPWVDASELTRWLGEAHERLLTDPVAAGARAYLRSRGVTGDLVRRYHLGYVGPDNDDDRLDLLRGRVVIHQWPHHVEGRVVPGQEERVILPHVRWLSARGSTKRWWRTDVVDVSRPVLLVEGPLDVLGADGITTGNAVGTLGKANVSKASISSLASRGLTEIFVCLDADATPDQWKRLLTALVDGGIRPYPVVGPTGGRDFGDLLALGDSDDYWTSASHAMSLPEAAQEVSA